MKKFLSFDRKENAYIVVNLNYDDFWNELIVESTDELMYFVFDQDYTMIFSDDFYSSELDKKTLEDIALEKDTNPRLSYLEDDLYLWKSVSTKYNWTFVVAQKLKDLFQPTYVLKKLTIISLFIILLLALVLAYIFSDYLYKPIRKLMNKINQITGVDQMHMKNDYQLIDKVIAYLFTQNVKLNSDYQYVFPYFKQYSIKDIINKNHFDLDNFKQVLDLLNIEFTFSNHYLVLIELENLLVNDDIKRKLEECFNEVGIKKIVSKINETRLLIILNSKKNINEIYGQLSDVHDRFNEENIAMTMSLSDDFQHLENINEHYEAIQKQLEYKFFVGKNKILFHMVSQQIEKKYLL